MGWQIQNRWRSGDYGDGSDGNAVLAVNTTLVRTMFYNNLDLNGFDLLPDQWSIHVKGRLRIPNGSKLRHNGNSGAGAVGGTSVVSANRSIAGTAGNGAGGTGNVGAGGNGGTAGNPCLGGSGGNGGAGNPGAAGLAGTAPNISGAPVPNPSRFWASPAFTNRYILNSTVGFCSFGSGGGGGGGDGVNAGGGGGSGAAGIMIFAREIVVENGGFIQANGGNGANAALGNCGGGGGGGGGVIWIFCDSASIAGTVEALGGVKGQKSGTGSDGVNGNAGTIAILVNRD